MRSMNINSANAGAVDREEVAAAGEVVFFAPAPAVRFVFGVVTGSFFAYEVAGATPVL